MKEERPAKVWLYLGCTFILSWSFWIPMAFSGQTVNSTLLAAGAIMPSILGILFTVLGSPAEIRRNFWNRIIDVRRIRPGWYFIVLFIYPAIIFLAFMAVKMTGGALPSLDAMMKTLSHPSQLAVFILLMFIGGPLAEELGWRGFVLDRFQSRWNALGSGIILGIIWTGWHFPLFFVKGTVQGAMGFGGILFTLWCIQVVINSVLYTWVYNNTRQSILAAVLMHMMWNSTGTIITQIGHELPFGLELARTIILMGVALTVIVVFGAKRLQRRQEPGGTVGIEGTSGRRFSRLHSA